MLRLAVFCAVYSCACGSTEQVALRLTADPDCAPQDFEAVETLSIEAFAQNGACKLAHSCVFNIAAQTEVDLEAAMRGAGDVLLDLSPDEVQTISVNGRPRNDCFPRSDGSNAPIVCGSANLASVVDGELEIRLQCGSGGDTPCIESLELCP